MRIIASRDSVSAGDDMEDHTQEVVLPDFADAFSYVAPLLALYELPSIATGHATWVMSSLRPIAVVAQQWKAPKPIGVGPLGLEELDVRQGKLFVHFSYLAQDDPGPVAGVLQKITYSAAGTA